MNAKIGVIIAISEGEAQGCGSQSSRGHLTHPAPSPPSPIPCSSGEMSREATSFQNTTDDILAIHPGSDDEMTLQDLIAVETIDESQMEEEDMHWSSQLSFDSFNYISQLTNFTDNKKPAIEFNSKNAGKSKKGSDPNKLKIKAGNSTVTSEVVAGLATNFLPSSFKMEPEIEPKKKCCGFY